MSPRGCGQCAALPRQATTRGGATWPPAGRVPRRARGVQLIDRTADGPAEAAVHSGHRDEAPAAVHELEPQELQCLFYRISLPDGTVATPTAAAPSAR